MGRKRPGVGAPVDLAVDLGARDVVGEVAGDRWIGALFSVSYVLEQAVCFDLEPLDTLAEGVVLPGTSAGLQGGKGTEYLCCVVRVAVRPDEVQVVLELPLRLVLLLLYLLEHGLKVHGV